MTNEMKLLMALTEALGFDVEQTNDVSYGRTITAGERTSWHGTKSVADGEWQFFQATSEMPEAEYREIIRSVDYKLTKKQEQPKTVCNNLLDELSELVISPKKGSTFYPALKCSERLTAGKLTKLIAKYETIAGGKHE